jgi:hypothetical protein
MKNEKSTNLSQNSQKAVDREKALDHNLASSMEGWPSG